MYSDAGLWSSGWESVSHSVGGLKVTDPPPSSWALLGTIDPPCLASGSLCLCAWESVAGFTTQRSVCGCHEPRSSVGVTSGGSSAVGEGVFIQKVVKCQLVFLLRALDGEDQLLVL